jgi:hypothetical protein
MMRGTRRTIVTAAASVAVVLGVGGVAAATSGHSWSDDPTDSTTTSVSVLTNRGGQHPRGRALGVRKQQLVTTTTVEDDTTSTTIADDDTTSTTVADEPTTVPTTPTTSVEGDEDHKVCDDHGKGDDDAADEDEGEHEANHEMSGRDHAKTTRADAPGHSSSPGGSENDHGKHGGRG